MGIASTVTDIVGDTDTHWTDVTRGFPHDFVVANVEDHRHDNQPHWMAMHPRMVPGTIRDANGNLVEKWQPAAGARWIGEVDYTGPCQKAFDRDCDHWYDEHDNCPDVRNDDQADDNDDGIGNACPPGPREIFGWVHMTVNPNIGNIFPAYLFEASYDPAEREEYVCRASYAGGLQPGNEHLGGCRFGWGGGQQEIDDFDILIYAPQAGDAYVPAWVAASNGNVPPLALLGGQESNGTPLYVCRASYSDGYVIGTRPGKIVGDGCNVAVNGVELHITSYEVLVHAPAPPSSGGSTSGGGGGGGGSGGGNCLTCPHPRPVFQ
jgi:hypothetical protein